MVRSRRKICTPWGTTSDARTSCRIGHVTELRSSRVVDRERAIERARKRKRESEEKERKGNGQVRCQTCGSSEMGRRHDGFKRGKPNSNLK